MNMDAPDTVFAGYPANPKARYGYRISGKAGNRMSGKDGNRKYGRIFGLTILIILQILFLALFEEN
jgi:hypothetical protein